MASPAPDKKTKSELSMTLDRAKRYVRTHLVECCREVLDSQDNGILCNGRVREAASIYAGIHTRGALKMALDEVARQAMERTAK
jgi:hypothetical protein